MNGELNPRSRRSFPSQPATPRAARAFVAEQLTERGASTTVIDDFVLAVSEMVSNAVAHADDPEVTLVVDTSDPQWWSIEVVSQTPLPSQIRRPEQWAVAATSDPSGRGLGIVHNLMDEVSVLDGGCIVALRRLRTQP